MQKDTLYLVDGNSIVYRSFYALKLSTSRGFPTGAIFGFINTLRKITKQYNPRYMAVCFDVSRRTHRQEKFNAYKINRPPAPDALKMQIPAVKKLIEYSGIISLEKEGFEADDLISSLTLSAQKQGWAVTIVSADKDMLQLIRAPGVIVYNPAKDIVYDHALFVDEFGFEPEHIVDYLALLGDASDNIPGAKGIGKIGARNLIQRFGTVENIFQHIESLPSKTQLILRNNKDSVRLSKELVALSDITGFGFSAETFRIKESDYDSIYKMCREFEFKSLSKEIPVPQKSVSIAFGEGLSLDAASRIRRRGVICFYAADNHFFVFEQDGQLSHRATYADIKDMLSDPGIVKVTYDVKEILRTFGAGAIARQKLFDIKIAAYLINSSLGDYALENICLHFLDVRLASSSPALLSRSISELFSLFDKSMAELALGQIFAVETDLIFVLEAMESAGVKIDAQKLNALTAEVTHKIDSAATRIFDIVGRTFNLNSPKQLRQVLFEELSLPPQKKTKTGYSTDEEVLKSLALRFPVARFLLEYRQLTKLNNTYLGPFAEEVEKHRGRLHARFHQTGTQTGRLSSSSPNLQSVPAKSDFARLLRGVFVSSFPDGYIVSGDYSQIELRILAHFSGEEKLIEAFARGKDVHQYTASLLFGIPQNEVQREQREVAKRVNFSIVYGMSSYGLARELAINEDQARSFIESYFLRYPKVKLFIDRTIKDAQDHGYVKTILGRIRYLPDITSPNFELREFSQRQAVNTPLQGTAADLIKIAMVRLFKAFTEQGLRSRMILQVHDELVFDVCQEELKKVVDSVKFIMENSISLTIPIVANLKTGRNWLELQEAEKI